jgi:hypothetical protein
MPAIKLTNIIYVVQAPQITINNIDISLPAVLCEYSSIRGNIITLIKVLLK